MGRSRGPSPKKNCAVMPAASSGRGTGRRTPPPERRRSAGSSGPRCPEESSPPRTVRTMNTTSNTPQRQPRRRQGAEQAFQLHRAVGRHPGGQPAEQEEEECADRRHDCQKRPVGLSDTGDVEPFLTLNRGENVQYIEYHRNSQRRLADSGPENRQIASLGLRRRCGDGFAAKSSTFERYTAPTTVIRISGTI